MPRIYLSPPNMSGHELKLVNDAFASNWIAPPGPHVDAFEREFAAARAPSKETISKCLKRSVLP